VAKLIYSSIASLDGYTVDENGGFDWAAPSHEVHAFVNDIERPIGTYLYGRRMYETMRYWEDQGLDGDQPPVAQAFARIWQGADKVVYSRTLEAISTARTRLKNVFDPEEVQAMKAAASADLSIGGPHLAAEAMRAGLVDEYAVFVTPILVGGGTRALPDGMRVGLELVDKRHFANGMVYLRYLLEA
jgi:dihydrofolate reductase